MGPGSTRHAAIIEIGRLAIVGDEEADCAEGAGHTDTMITLGITVARRKLFTAPKLGSNSMVQSKPLMASEMNGERRG